MEFPPPATNDTPPTPFDWSDLFDLPIDDQLFINLDHPSPPVFIPPETTSNSPTNRSDSSDRIRKRDPRMVCENFMAGRVPCACPEMDAKEEEEARLAPGKKRVRLARTPGLARCQVPQCEVDISELKGYHRRHRVCLNCANAVSVVLEGESKRYCQQCGKFHIMSDFDEGKRSCRRKLERHNNRRRRKPADARGAIEKEPQGDLLTEDVSSDGEAGKETTWTTSQMTEREDSKDGALSNLCSTLESQIIENGGTMTFIQADKAVDDSKHDNSHPFDNKSTYSSLCPTGRISFKLYDWNPAEFPRRLRHQIFQWLASMPIELEGYIRPGCTILTSFVSMPQCMWMKLFEDPVSYLQSFVGPGGILSGKGTALVHLNNMTFRVMKGGASIVKVNVAVRGPKLHYIYPPCFEAGKPMDFIACGTNLLQPKFRSLISFAGKYLPHDYYVAFPRGKDEAHSAVEFDYQFCKIYVPHTEPSFCGPAFIEVENECGLSNFIPILIGDESVCSEIWLIHQKFDCSCCEKSSQLRPIGSSPTLCEVSCSRQIAFSEFMLDVAWLLKWPPSEKFHHAVTTSHIKRINMLLDFLIRNESHCILQRILSTLQIVLDEIESSGVPIGVSNSDKMLFKKHVGHARDFVAHKNEFTSWQNGSSVPQDNNLPQNLPDNGICISQGGCQVKGTRAHMSSSYLGSQVKDEYVSLLPTEVSMKVTDNREWSRKSCNLTLPRKYVNSRPFIYMIAAVAVCLGVCAIVLHPNKANKIAVTIRRCLFENSSS